MEVSTTPCCMEGSSWRSWCWAASEEGGSGSRMRGNLPLMTAGAGGMGEEGRYRILTSAPWTVRLRTLWPEYETATSKEP